MLQANLRGRPFKHYDTAGVATTASYDFKGNSLGGTRQLLKDYKTPPDWLKSPPLEPEVFASSTAYDALNRPIQIIAPHSDQIGVNFNVVQPGYSEANLLERMDAWLSQSTKPSAALDLNSADLHAVTNIDYNAKGQRTRIDYGNGASTEYSYDELTFRLIHLRTSTSNNAPPGSSGSVFQDLFYTYDPVGNITHTHDNAQQTIYFNNQVVLPTNNYVYDPIYRLTQATGREHIGQLSQPQTSWDDKFRTNISHPADGSAMRNYTEQYFYDAAGNFERLVHQAPRGGWTRTYTYNEISLLEGSKRNNRLSNTAVGSTKELYSHDAHGNIIAMPHLTLMQWDFKDQLGATSRQSVVPGSTAETTHYVYDSGGQRTRKVTERQDGSRKEERVYLGGFELYRQFAANGSTVAMKRETLHVMDDKQRIALVETRTEGDDGSPSQLVRFQLSNHLGSASLELDGAGAVISYEEYFPYGSSSYQAVDQSIKATAKRYRFTGKERDEESGFYYHGARCYAPWLGRWISCDPFFDRTGNSLYVYVHDDPINRFDPDGREDSFYERHEFVIEVTKQFFRRTLPGIAELEEAELLDKPADSLTAKRAQKLGDDYAVLFALGDLLGSGTRKGPGGGPRTGGGLELAPATGPVPARVAAPPVVVARPPAYFAENKSAEETKTTPEAARPAEPLSREDQNRSSSPPPSNEKLYTALPPSEPNQSPDPRATKTPNSQIDAERQKFLDNGGTVRVIKRATELHHIASDKSAKYTPIFEKLFADAGLSLQDDANLVRVEGHGNAHGPDYHEAILARLNKAVEGKTPGSQEYKDALTKGLGEAKQDIANRPGSTLNRLVTRK
jgi:RHS repeat-associated protein